MSSVIRTAALAGIGLALLAATAHGEEARARSYALPGHGALTLTVPVSWKDEVRPPKNREPMTIAFARDKGPAFSVFVTPWWPVNPNPPPVTADGLRRLVEQATVLAKQQSVEQQIEVKALTGASGPGYYFSATDRAPAPGEFKHLTQGTIKIGAIGAAFTILTNDGQTDVVAAALAMIAGATHAAP